MKQNEFFITLDNEKHPEKVIAEIIDRKIWFKHAGQTYSYDILELSRSRSRGGSKAAGKSPDRILAPMPGKLTKIFVNVGDAVIKGQALVVMEAMKMEYTLKSDLDAIIAEIPVKLNDQVNLGSLLVRLEVGAP